MTSIDNAQALIRLLTWMSPAFPIGAFSYSGGLEAAVQDRRVEDAASLSDWISLVLSRGALWNDAILLKAAAEQASDKAALLELSELGLALAGSGERYRETLLLGQAFRDAAKAWPVDVLSILPDEVPYPVAVGAVGAGNGLATHSVLVGYLHSGASQLVSAAIRLSVCGQSQALAILAALEPQIERVAERALLSTLDDLGTATIGADISSLRHEVMHSRLFRS
jgi:urease accessory protein